MIVTGFKMKLKYKYNFREIHSPSRLRFHRCTASAHIIHVTAINSRLFALIIIWIVIVHKLLQHLNLQHDVNLLSFVSNSQLEGKNFLFSHSIQVACLPFFVMFKDVVAVVVFYFRVSSYLLDWGFYMYENNIIFQGLLVLSHVAHNSLSINQTNDDCATSSCRVVKRESQVESQESSNQFFPWYSECNEKLC